MKRQAKDHKTTNMHKREWYSEEYGFFGPEYLAEYENVLTPERTAREVDFLEKALKLHKHSTILDCPCGHGRHAVELARRGYHVTGQDINEFFLEKAAREAERSGVSVEWRKGDMRNVSFGRKFDVGLSLFSAFGYFDDDRENQKVISAFAEVLTLGGRLVLDVINREWLLNNYKTNQAFTLSNGSAVHSEAHFDLVTGRNIEKRTRIDKKGKRHALILSLRMYTFDELRKMLSDAGFAIENTYGNYQGDALTSESKRSILVAVKL